MSDERGLIMTHRPPISIENKVGNAFARSDMSNHNSSRSMEVLLGLSAGLKPASYGTRQFPAVSLYVTPPANSSPPPAFTRAARRTASTLSASPLASASIGHPHSSSVSVPHPPHVPIE